MHWQKNLNLFIKAALAALIMHVILFPDLTQYQNKAMGYRLIFYPSLALSLFIAHKFKLIKNNYPHYQDILISLVITLDMFGNTFGLYGSIEWWDDIMHLINCGLITLLVISIIPSIFKNHVVYKFIYTVGVVSFLQIIWEIAEYFTFITTNHNEISTAYRDTIGDLFFGQIGTYLAFFVILRLSKRTKNIT